jgi:hypothetical protein
MNGRIKILCTFYKSYTFSSRSSVVLSFKKNGIMMGHWKEAHHSSKISSITMNEQISILPNKLQRYWILHYPNEKDQEMLSKHERLT